MDFRCLSCDIWGTRDPSTVSTCTTRTRPEFSSYSHVEAWSTKVVYTTGLTAQPVRFCATRCASVSPAMSLWRPIQSHHSGREIFHHWSWWENRKHFRQSVETCPRRFGCLAEPICSSRKRPAKETPRRGSSVCGKKCSRTNKRIRKKLS